MRKRESVWENESDREIIKTYPLTSVYPWNLYQKPFTLRLRSYLQCFCWYFSQFPNQCVESLGHSGDGDTLRPQGSQAEPRCQSPGMCHLQPRAAFFPFWLSPSKWERLGSSACLTWGATHQAEKSFDRGIWNTPLKPKVSKEVTDTQSSSGKNTG